MPIKSTFQFSSNNPDDILRKILEERNAKLLNLIRDVACAAGHQDNGAFVSTGPDTKPVITGCCEDFVEAARAHLKELGLLKDT